MQLTKLQRKALSRAKELKSSPFPVFGTIVRHWKFYLIISVALGGYSYFSYSVGYSLIAGISLGVLIGLFLRDIKFLRLQSKMWSMNILITDWEKVDRLLEQQSET